MEKQPKHSSPKASNPTQNLDVNPESSTLNIYIYNIHNNMSPSRRGSVTGRRNSALAGRPCARSVLKQTLRAFQTCYLFPWNPILRIRFLEPRGHEGKQRCTHCSSCAYIEHSISRVLFTPAVFRDTQLSSSCNPPKPRSIAALAPFGWTMKRIFTCSEEGG